ncbi:MAG: ABC transporter permease [Clostridiaceae bacterium]|nr:ABC transporter permease [Clostridiaceae bacterium]
MSENKKKIVKSSLAKENFYKLLHNRLAVLGFMLMFVILMACILAPLLTPHSPTDLNLRHMGKPPGGEHPFGTDKLGRDVFARVLYGGRISIAIGLSGALGGMILGVIIGSFCGYYGGWLDAIFVKIAELVSVFPQLLLVMVMRVILGEGIKNLIIIFVFTGWIATFRLVRGRFFSLREESFVEACRAFGIRSSSIVFRHILPNCLGPVIVQLTLNTAGFILQEAALSFIGMGVPSGTPTWGNTINAAKELLNITNYPWLWVAPGLAIAFFVLGVNFFGDGLRDVLDPKQQ